MPKSPSAETVRERAHQRALATVASLPTPPQRGTENAQTCPSCGNIGSSLDEFLSPHNGKCSDCQILPAVDMSEHMIPKQEETPLPETQEQEMLETHPADEPPKRRPRGPNKPKEPEAEQPQSSLRRGIGEGFLEYQARIPANEWVSNIYGNYIYKLLGNGKKKRVEDQPRLQPLTMGDLREIAAQHGPGEYYIQFTVKTPNLSSCFETFTFDDDGRGAVGSSSFSKNDPEGIAYSAKVAADITKEAAREGLAMVREERVERNKQPDIAALVTALAGALAPKQAEDKTMPLIMKMLENQAAEAQRRADAAEKRAEDQRRADREDAERRERQAKDDAERARERDKQFFDMMLSQANNKADSLNQFTGLLSNFLKVKNEIDDTMGGGPKGAWDVAGTVIDGLIQQGPAIVAAVKGASPQQVQQMQQAANPEAQPPAMTPQMQFRELVNRIGMYCRRDSEKWNESYIGEMIQEEYGGLAVELFENEPKEKIVEAFQLTPPGDVILAHPDGQAFIGKLIDWFKSETPEEDDEPEIIMVDPKGVAMNPRQKRINGKAKHG